MLISNEKQFISHPKNGSKACILPISNKLIDTLNMLPKRSYNVFASLTSSKVNFYKTHKALAFKLQNPKLKEPHLHTFRHWFATMEYHKTKYIVHVQYCLGHRDIKSATIYINKDAAIFQNTEDEYASKVALNTEEACKLIDVGFEYVTGEYNDGGKIFRKRK